MNGRKVLLQSKDGESFLVDFDVAMCSNILKCMFENLECNTDCVKTDVVPIPEVKGSTLRRVIIWAEHYRFASCLSEDQADKQYGSCSFDEWETSFLNMDNESLFDLILAANFLDIESLLSATARAVANLIKGKSPEEIREIFGLSNDFTPEEYEQVKMEFDGLMIR